MFKNIPKPAKRQILQNQSAITGLFPSNSADGSNASIKTSLWAASSIFALYLAYSKRVDNDQGKAHDLGQSVVKCMRGILFAWMRQSERVESFKANQCPEHALHLKFDLHSGLASDHDYPHLQIDVVSLYLIFLANFIASGLDIIYCMDEVTFIQNLVYYVERAYRTPDFGNWEPTSSGEVASASEWPAPQRPGSPPPPPPQSSTSGQHDLSPPKAHQASSQKHFITSTPNCARQTAASQMQQQHHHHNPPPPLFDQTPLANYASNREVQSLEIHATSIGMAKSALEAINGCNLFGGKGANWSIIYSDIDAHSRNRSIFETLLPRESRSKNTDSYLLATISWPCFATSDQALYSSTKSKILRKLRGKYGLKRFLRDPYGTVLGLGQAHQQQLQAHMLLHPTSGGGGGESCAQSPQASFERESSFGSTSSGLSQANSDSLQANRQPKPKQRKSSYFQRKIKTTPPGLGEHSQHHHHHHAHPHLHQQNPDQLAAVSQLDQSAQTQGLQRTESTSAKMSKRFEHIESEWPLFVCFLIIDGIFKQDFEQINENEKLLYENLLKVEPKFGDYLMPKYYYVPIELINNEKCHPDSVERMASVEGSSSDQLYLTGQSILLITRLLLAGLVHPNELDPLHRHQPAHDRPKRSIGRYSSFQAT